ncbi:hypothetical protein BD779DRAFT_1528356 [Infundibulicybe gibba]|nr:hypothetical protein BD779DRAFT_1528356 [Infundibulicybe gibba]
MNPEVPYEKFARILKRQGHRNARQGCLVELAELANFWQEFPTLFAPPVVMGIFFGHLDPDKTPTDPSRAMISNFLEDREIYVEESAFFYASPKRSTIDIITGAWYSLGQVGKVRDMMARTQGSIEIATQLWVLEDSGPAAITNIPSGSASLDSLLKSYRVPSLLDRVVESAGAHTVICLDLIGHLSWESKHALRYAFLNSNIIATSTKLILTVSKLLHAGGNTSLLAVMVSAFGYLSNCLESTDGFTWVTQSLNAGLLLAFIECHPFYAILDPEDRDMVFSIFRDVLPKYLVYRSVISAVDGGMKRAEQSPHNSKISDSPAKNVWQKFRGLALERLVVTMQAKAFKGRQSPAIMSRSKRRLQCHKVDTKSNFRKSAAWKEGGHKSMCKMKQRERLGKTAVNSKSDASFFHHLATRDARRHLPHLRRLAKQDWPGTTDTGLVVCIDYTIAPEKYSLLPLAEYVRLRPQSAGSANKEARNEALIERAMENPGRFTLIQSMIANGQANRNWVEDDSYSAEDGENQAPATNIDGVDLIMGRMLLNNILGKMGEPPAF